MKWLLRLYAFAVFSLFAIGAGASTIATTGAASARGFGFGHSAGSQAVVTVMQDAATFPPAVNYTSPTLVNIAAGQTVVLWVSCGVGCNASSYGVSDPTGGTWTSPGTLTCCGVPVNSIQQFVKTFTSPLAAGSLFTVNCGGSTCGMFLMGNLLPAGYTAFNATQAAGNSNSASITATGFTGTQYLTVVGQFNRANPPTVTGTGAWISGAGQSPTGNGFHTWYQFGTGTSMSFGSSFTSDTFGLGQASFTK